MVRSSREELLNRRMKTNNYDDETLEEMRGRIRRIDGHRTSSLSDIKNFEKEVNLSSLKENDGSTIFISESTLMELKKKVDESETQKHFMNALRERLKELNHEKEAVVKKYNMDQEIIKKKSEEIRRLEEENRKLNKDLKELTEILDNYKQRMSELENCNNSINILTESDMQSRVECGIMNKDDHSRIENGKNGVGSAVIDRNFIKGEMKTLQEELLINESSGVTSSSQSLHSGYDVSDKEKNKSRERRVLFNEITERFASEQVDEMYEEGMNKLTYLIDRNANKNKQEWLSIMMKLSGLVVFRSKILLMRQFLENEENELVNGLSIGLPSQDKELTFRNTSENNSNKRLNNVGYSGPNENKIKVILSPIKAVINEIIQRMDGNMESFDSIENVILEKKRVLKVLQEQISYLKEKIERGKSVSNGNSSNCNNSRITSFSDLITEREYTDGGGCLSLRSSKFSERMRNNAELGNSLNRRLLSAISRLKLWIVEEILYDEYVVECYLYKDVDYNRIISRFDINNNEFIMEMEDEESNTLKEIEDKKEYNGDYGFLGEYKYLSFGIVQMIYVLNKQWERSILNENELLIKLQEMVRIYHRLKSFILTSKDKYLSFCESSNRCNLHSSSGNSNDNSVSTLGEDNDSGNKNLHETFDFESLHLTNENNYVLCLERELTSLGLGILSGRDLSNSASKSILDQEQDNLIGDDKVEEKSTKGAMGEKCGSDIVLRREQVNEILKRLDKYPDPMVANRNQVLSIRELIRPLKSYGRRAPEPYIGFYALLTFRLDMDIEQHDREIRAFQKVIKGLEDQCDRQQEELEELHEELEQLYEIIEKEGIHSSRQETNSIEGERNSESDSHNNCAATDHSDNRASEHGMSDKEWLSLCRKTSLGQS